MCADTHTNAENPARLSWGRVAVRVGCFVLDVYLGCLTLFPIPRAPSPAPTFSPSRIIRRESLRTTFNHPICKSDRKMSGFLKMEEVSLYLQSAGAFVFGLEVDSIGVTQSLHP